VKRFPLHVLPFPTTFEGERRIRFHLIHAKTERRHFGAKVALLRYVRIARGWRRFRVHAIRKGRGWDERISPPEGAEILEKGGFQLRWYRGGDAVYKGVGHDLQEAITARENQTANLEAERAALAAGRKLVSKIASGIACIAGFQGRKL
jgi:hypothetical protein